MADVMSTVSHTPALLLYAALLAPLLFLPLAHGGQYSPAVALLSGSTQNAAAVAADFSPAEVVDHHDDDVGFILSMSTERTQ